ncbi:hypothetical protein M422DRAFT_251649 [Sphaerobolus stellatus SS14]|uniref:Uncharacterized protein n=1 Tax=Sphaerobolus stellatus (strain SS14) TaxID=990650 RepID=A0A0C9W0P1_SPHS4|nr:hypothetical protein M422DRAFT_251649 [Sphaerobolus stellatus SS14]
MRFGNSDHYLAYSYDMLHAFDFGEWGKHQWPFFRDHLTEPQKAQLTRKDILKSILPCIVDILPRDSVVVHAIRLCGIIRTIASLNHVSDEQIDVYRRILIKNYNYPKHHTLLHLPEDLQAKGSTLNHTTRPGEGFQQEVQQAYDQTNFKNTEAQMTRIDENQEAIARIRTAVDIHNKLMKELLQEQNITDGDECPTPVASKDHWSLGSLLSSISARIYELEHAERKGFRRFEKKLLSFLSEHINAGEKPSEPLEDITLSDSPRPATHSGSTAAARQDKLLAQTKNSTTAIERSLKHASKATQERDDMKKAFDDLTPTVRLGSGSQPQTPMSPSKHERELKSKKKTSATAAIRGDASRQEAAARAGYVGGAVEDPRTRVAEDKLAIVRTHQASTSWTRGMCFGVLYVRWIWLLYSVLLRVG